MDTLVTTVMVLGVFGVLFVLGWALFRLLVPAKGKPMVCATCGKYGPTAQLTKGSISVEVVLWLLFLVPGLVYSMWRMSTRTVGCPACGGTTLIPADSPVGKRLIKDFQDTAAG